MSKKTKIIVKDWQALVKEIRQRSSISLKELALLAKKRIGVGPDYVIWMLQQQGVIKWVQGRRRGLYVVVRDHSADTLVKDPIEAIQTLYGVETLFCYGTALYLHGLSRYGSLSEYFLHTDVPRTQRPVGQVAVRFVKTRLGNSIGIAKKKYGARSVTVTDVERTIIDCIHRTAYAQGWENVVHAMKRAKNVKGRRLVGYLKRYGLPSLVTKTGVVLEHFARQWKVPKGDLDSLVSYLPREPVKFVRGQKGSLNKRWNIYVPGDFLRE